MEQAKKPIFEQLYQALQRLVGLHRQLLDNVRMERKSLVDADLKGIQDATVAKQALVEAIRQAEFQRQKCVAELAVATKVPVRDLTLANLVLAAQAIDNKLAEQFRTAQNALNLLIQRIVEQNDDNKSLVEKSLAHVNEMKRNVLGEAAPKSSTYNQQGQRANPASGARMLSREA